MTCKEKLAVDHLEWGTYELTKALDEDCPDHYGYLPTPTNDNGTPVCSVFNCDQCWLREIPGTPDISNFRKALDIVSPPDPQNQPDIFEITNRICVIRRQLIKAGFTSEETFHLIIKMLEVKGEMCK